MKLKLNYFVIPLIVLIFATLGNYASMIGVDEWYLTLEKPSITPPNYIFGVAWSFIYLCTTLSTLLVWNSKADSSSRKMLMGAYVFNGFLNVLWSYIFFVLHEMGIAFIEMLFLNISVVFIMCSAYKINKVATALLLPYIGWALFATVLTYQFIMLNPQYGF